MPSVYSALKILPGSVILSAAGAKVTASRRTPTPPRSVVLPQGFSHAFCWAISPCVTVLTELYAQPNPYFRNKGRVRQVGPPDPLMQISDPANVLTSNPASRNRRFVLTFSSIAISRAFPSDSTLQASVSRSE